MQNRVIALEARLAQAAELQQAYICDNCAEHLIDGYCSLTGEPECDEQKIYKILTEGEMKNESNWSY